MRRLRDTLPSRGAYGTVTGSDPLSLLTVREHAAELRGDEAYEYCPGHVGGGSAVPRRSGRISVLLEDDAALDLPYPGAAMDALDDLALDLETALQGLVNAVRELIPAPHDVFDPDTLVRRWVANLDADRRGRLLVLLLSNPSEHSLHSVARAAVTGGTEWHVPTATAGSTDSPAVVQRSAAHEQPPGAGD